MKNIPALRFKEFSNEWETKTLGDVGKIIGGGTPETINPEFWNGNINWFTPTELKTKYVKESIRTISELGLKKSSAKILPKGTLLLSSRATVGDISIALCECSTNQGFQSIVVNSKNSNEFVYYWITKNKKELVRKACGSTFLEISKTEISKIKINLPDLKEQQKIADFFVKIDNRIEKLEKKKQLLEKYKKGVMQKIFNQEIRFKNDNGEDFSKWEEKRLGNISIFLKGKGISKSDISENGKLECIRYGELYTEYNEIIFYTKSKTNVDEKDLVLSEKNDVIIPASGETALEIAKASCVLKDNVALGSDINIIRTKSDGIFLSYYLNNNLKKEISSLAQGHSVVHLYSSQLKTLKINLPCLEEQQKISSFLTKIANKISLVEKQLNGTKKYKKGLLQQIFI